MRHVCCSGCRYVDKNRYQTKMSESIIDKYAFPGSSVYAPPQREGRFPDSRPKGKGIETEHFVPSAMAGLQALEEYLPKRMLEARIQVGRHQSQPSTRPNHHRYHALCLSQTFLALVSARFLLGVNVEISVLFRLSIHSMVHHSNHTGDHSELPPHCRGWSSQRN